MRWIILLLVLGVGAILAGCGRRKEVVPPSIMPEQRHAQDVTLPGGNVVASGYLLYLPATYAQTDAAWPLLMFLHGSGESGADLDRVTTQGLPRRLREIELPCVIVAPQCPREDDWTFPGQQQRLSNLIETMATRYRIDRQRIYLTGISMGGYAVWDLAITHPHRFAAIVPICGRGQPGAAERISHLPAWVFHGVKDELISVDVSRQMVEALRASGSTVRFTEYPEGGHDVWTETYQNPALFEWLFEQRLPDAALPQP
ncbi:MAG: prolyl oligopeptidase family serine peptidase [Verrucomicrobia bacterium]|jgi:predicted peptidase|nr:prolyl oligopeptidase family serine peptidase [Verrucomicrobiota bacterium]MBT7067417.1 prolyl oligopeptidase family serine peptidase [Verrucomicrobiota bacterium]MBT7700061.1 prolyl oligopeptidase family serine peptidase [Verrucomicrobiota bacterium]